MARYRLNLKAMKANGLAAVKSIEVGGVYFYSNFYDKEGAYVKVVSKSEKTDRSGWAESVTCEVIEPVGFAVTNAFSLKYYAPGTVHSINATNLYKNREDASHAAKFGPNPEDTAHKLMSALTGISSEKIKAICNAK
jgi:hypothetical protein